MDLEQSKAWLGLAQQPYPVVSAFLESIHFPVHNQLKRSQANAEEHYKISDLLSHWLVKHSCKIDDAKLEESLDWLIGGDHHLMSYVHFPEALKSIQSPPPVLFLEGNKDLLFEKSIAIVGSRKPTHSGREITAWFSEYLATHNLVIISGMAMGIDGIAHQSALNSNGATIAVLGCGHLTCYPKRHKKLFQDIKKTGLVVSEFDPKTPVKAFQFPKRNRIISGLSLGVLVTEAAIKSGSLITCKTAADQGRDVYAVPGDIRNPLSQGCHYMIQQGASLVSHPKEILQSLELEGHFNSSSQLSIIESNFEDQKQSSNKNARMSSLSKKQFKVLNCVDKIPTNVNQIVERSGFDIGPVLSILFSLELDGHIYLNVDGYTRL